LNVWGRGNFPEKIIFYLEGKKSRQAWEYNIKVNLKNCLSMYALNVSGSEQVPIERFCKKNIMKLEQGNEVQLFKRI